MITINQRILLDDLNNLEKQLLVKDTYNQYSYFQEKFLADSVTFSCEKISVELRHQIERLLHEKNIIHSYIPLEKLHLILSDELRAYNFDDGVNKISSLLYETDSQFTEAFSQLIWFIRENIIHEAFYFQATPTIRIHCPDSKNSHHYPRYHTDIGYGHPPQEINFWLPLTAPQHIQPHGFRIMNLESSKHTVEKFRHQFSALNHAAIVDKEFSQYCETVSTPVKTTLGHIMAFDSRCLHSGEPLIQHTRVSIDIRVIPVTEYEKMTLVYRGLGRRKILFAPGHCYHEKNSDQYLTFEG